MNVENACQYCTTIKYNPLRIVESPYDDLPQLGGKFMNYCPFCGRKLSTYRKMYDLCICDGTNNARSVSNRTMEIIRNGEGLPPLTNPMDSVITAEYKCP